jgi:predicted RNA-binding protein with TRAM domain
VGTEYYYAVTAVTEGGEGLMSRVVSAVPQGLPGAPRDLTTLPRDGEVFLSWTEPESTGALPITGYIILRGTRTDVMKELIRLGPRLNFTDSKVVNGRTYHYAIAAVNEMGTGPFTETVQGTPFGPSTGPGAPRTLTGTVKGTKVTLIWTPPESDGGAEIEGYVVLRGPTPYSLEPVAELGVVLTYTDEGLKEGTTYYYSLVAVNEVGEGEPVTAIMMRVQKTQDDGPGFPAAIALMAIAGVSLVAVRRRCR